jgi:signal peptide peptidase SppA
MHKSHLWLGTQQAYEAAVEARAKVEADPKFSASTSYSSEVLSQILHVQDGVATINISGSLVDGSAGFGVFFGTTGYEDIRAALASSVANPNVSSILLNVSSGGGEVSGVHETAQLISRVSKVKPVVTYVGGNMASAALWLGASASSVVAAETALVGSIGILMVHMDRSKMLSDMGVKPTVIRAGEEKTLATPYETLTENAKANLQKQADGLYDIFIKHVAQSRGMNTTAADAKFGQGKEFLGKAAVSAGLVDSVGTLESAYTLAVSLGADKRKGKKPTMKASTGATASMITEGASMPKPLTDEQLAAMAAGVELPAADAESVTPTASGAENPEDPDGEDDVAAASAATASTASTAPSEAANPLQALFVQAQSDLVEAKASLKLMEVQKAEATALTDKFVEIARASVKTMGLHFNVKADAVAAMSAVEVLAEHGRLATLFKERFKGGAVAATNTLEGAAKPVKAAVDPLFLYAAKSLN